MKNDEFHASFILRQHTPMIHFQADHPGALLRVSELKPAFDSYLWKNVFKVGSQSEQRRTVFDQYKMYLTGYSTKVDDIFYQAFEQENWSLDYRVRIDTGQTRATPIPPKYPCFFGDMGEVNTSVNRQFVQALGNVTVTFTCLYPELKKIIGDRFADFLRTKNFGLRQSKGFGCFTADHNNEPVIPVKANNAYYFRVNTSDPKTLFRHIELFWRVLRTGYNKPNQRRETDIYIKCPLFFYLRDQWHIDVAETNVSDLFKARIANKPVQWDKRSIKQAYFSSRLSAQQARPNADILEGFPTKSLQSRYFLFRDLLGLASESQWMGYSASIKKKHIPNRGEETIDRFKSPVTFKPIRKGGGYDVYVCVKLIPEEFTEQTFQIQRNNERPTLTLETPPKGAFRITKYFDFVLREIAERIVDEDENVVTLNAPNDADWSAIKAIFSTFRKINS